MTTQTLRGMANARLDALARRPHRRQRSGRQRLRRGRRVPEVQRRLRGPARPRRHRSPSSRDAGVRRLHPAASRYPPNPIRKLDNSLTAAQQAGRNFMTGSRRADGLSSVGGGTRLQLRRLPHARTRRSGFFGTDGEASFEDEPQILKIPHLRNMYQKVGMFGMPASASSTRRQRPQGRSDPRLRLPARRQHRHRLPLPAGERVQRAAALVQPAPASRTTRSGATSSSSCWRSTRPGADRRPADHADNTNAADGRSAHQPADPARRCRLSRARLPAARASATWS